MKAHTAIDQSRTISIVLAVSVWLLIVSLVAPAQAIGIIDNSFVIFHYGGADSLSKIGGFLTSLGDINGDGIDDIGVGCLSPKGTYVFLGGATIDSFPDQFLKGLRAQSGDLNGDGSNDILTIRQYNAYDLFAGTNYFYMGFPESLSTYPVDSVYSSDSTEFLGAVRSVDKVTGGLELDVLTEKYVVSSFNKFQYYEDVYVDRIADWEYGPQNSTHFIADGGFVDFNGDGNKDIFLGLRPLADPDSNGLVLIFYGPTFPDSPSVRIYSPADIARHRMEFAVTTSNVGDVNADGWPDIGVALADTGIVYYCGAVSDTLYDIQLVKQGNLLTSIGDINKDGFSDLATYGYAYSGKVDIYLGGPDFDGYMDDEVRESDLPVWEQMDVIGYRISPAGDFNGDGIDDFMFATQNYCCPSDADPGEVFVIRGAPNIKTDVSESQSPLIPSSLILSQNYPNPFNPSTTIEFNLPRKSQVRLEIFNLSGQLVSTLLDESVSAGSHSIKWDGRNGSGIMMASGIYFYSLKTESTFESKKMILLK